MNGLRDYGTATWQGGDQNCDHKKKTPEKINSSLAKSKLSGGPEGQRVSYENKQHNKSICNRCGAIRVDKQIGLEKTPEQYIEKMVAVFRECRRVLKDDGTLWLNIGDSYCGYKGDNYEIRSDKHVPKANNVGSPKTSGGIKPKDLIGIPWKLAEALREPFYTGKIKSERDRIWMAAILDGEGSISGFEHIRKDGTGIRYGVNICITNSSQKILDECVRIFPAARIDHMPNLGGHFGKRRIERWVPSGCQKRADFLKEIYPYLVEKKQQALIAWNLCQLTLSSKKDMRSPVADQQRSRRKILVDLLKQLNAGKEIVIPQWIKDIPPLYEQGFYLRQDIIWAKRNCLPESVNDRCTKSHEYIFLLTKSPKYYYDQVAIRTPLAENSIERLSQDIENQQGTISPNGATRTDRPFKATASWNGSSFDRGKTGEMKHTRGGRTAGNKNHKYVDEYNNSESEEHRTKAGLMNIADTVFMAANKRSVWTVATKPFSGAHFATFPEDLIVDCIKAGTSEHGQCSKCGKPWVRMSEKELKPTYKASPGTTADDRDYLAGDNDQSSNRVKDGHKPGFYNEYTTTGWQPTCKCKDAAVIPDVVLDPFGGAGTTPLVAKKLQRNFVAIEINPKYVKDIAIPRLKKELGMFYTPQNDFE